MTKQEEQREKDLVYQVKLLVSYLKAIINDECGAEDIEDSLIKGSVKLVKKVEAAQKRRQK